MNSRDLFTTDAEYIEFLEQRCKTLALATSGVREMLEDKNRHIMELSKTITREHEKRVKAQWHIVRLKRSLAYATRQLHIPVTSSEELRRLLENEN